MEVILGAKEGNIGIRECVPRDKMRLLRLFFRQCTLS